VTSVIKTTTTTTTTTNSQFCFIKPAIYNNSFIE